MPSFSPSVTLLTVAIILLFARPANAFGAGNIASISKVEGLNCKYSSSSLARAQESS
jgi:hypothetical protein